MYYYPIIIFLWVPDLLQNRVFIPNFTFLLTFLNSLQVEELRSRLEEKNRVIEKKTQTALQATQDKNRVTNEINELKDHVDIKDRKINVLQRKVCNTLNCICCAFLTV